MADETLNDSLPLAAISNGIEKGMIVSESLDHRPPLDRDL